MVTIVDPLLVPIPKDFLQRKDHREFFERIIRTITQLRDRTGGASDNISENSTRESYPWVLEDPKTEVINLNHETNTESVSYEFSTYLREFRGVTVSSDYASVPWDWVNAQRGVTVTFPKYPSDGDELIVTNDDGSIIGLDGNGKKINGSHTGTLRRKYTSIKFKYFVTVDEWRAI